jgi:hypothetical protein
MLMLADPIRADSKKEVDDRAQRSINDLIAVLDTRMSSILYAVEEVRKDAERKSNSADFGVSANLDRVIGSALASDLASLKSRLESLHAQAKKALEGRNFILFNEVSNQIRDLLEAKKAIADDAIPKHYAGLGDRRSSLRWIVAEYTKPLPGELVEILPDVIAAQWVRDHRA